MEPLPLAVLPTPVRRLGVPGLRGRLWIKDDGVSSPVYGGNKVRKLALLLADARLGGATDLVTVGAVGSHHVLATAIHGAAHGLRTHALLFAQPDSEHVRREALAIDRYCASWAILPGVGRGAMAAAAHYLRVRRATGSRPYAIPLGGSNALGTLGWLHGGLELAAQIRAGELPAAARVYVAVGTGGTAAGLLAGLALAGVDAEVVGVRVASRLVANPLRIRQLASGAMRRYGARSRLGRVRVVEGWMCGGYGRWDERVEAAIARGRAAGVETEPTYTGKAFGACLEELGRDAIDAVYVHTFSAVEPPVEVGPLPPELERLLR